MKKVLLFTIAMLFALVAKAALTIEPIAGEDKAYRITVNEPADLGPAIIGNSNNVFYTEEDGTEVRVSEVKRLDITTASGVTIGNAECENLATKFTSLNYLDLENCSINNINQTATAGANKNPLRNFNSTSSLRTLIFPNADGLKIPAYAFKNNSYLETVIFPDNAGSYYIMEEAFLSCTNLKTLSLGKGFSAPDIDNQGRSTAGYGKSSFEHCKNLSTVVLDNSITALGEKMFAATYKLEYLVLPEELIQFGSLCFKESGLRTITIPDHVNLTGQSTQAFQYCGQLRNIYVNADNVKIASQGLMEMNQTSNFKWGAGDNPTYSVADYYSTAVYDANTYGDNPMAGQRYTVPVFHYPGTVDAINNYRVPKYMVYSGVNPETGTTWPTASEIDMYNGITKDGVYYRPYSYDEDGTSDYAGWRQFILGGNIFKEQKVFYDERIKESRWYSICLPVNMTKAQFMTAYGVEAELKEFSGAVYDEDEKMIILQFDKDAEEKNGYLLQKNTPYMIHPAKIKFTKVKTIEYADMNGGVKFITETVDGQEQYKTKDAIATFDVESDIFIKWDVLLGGGQALADRITEILDDTDTDLAAKAVTKALTVSSSNPDNIPPHNYMFRGSIDGATVAAPGYNGQEANVKIMRNPSSPVKVPEGAYYLAYDPDLGVNTPKFYKSRGGSYAATWSPYCALIEPTGSSTSGAKEFDMLDVDFNGMTENIVVTGIGNPTIQIPVTFANDKVYNLNGQVVRDNTKNLSGLKGIYIIGGKKVVVK